MTRSQLPKIHALSHLSSPCRNSLHFTKHSMHSLWHIQFEGCTFHSLILMGHKCSFMLYTSSLSPNTTPEEAKAGSALHLLHSCDLTNVRSYLHCTKKNTLCTEENIINNDVTLMNINHNNNVNWTQCHCSEASIGVCSVGCILTQAVMLGKHVHILIDNSEIPPVSAPDLSQIVQFLSPQTSFHASAVPWESWLCLLFSCQS